MSSLDDYRSDRSKPLCSPRVRLDGYIRVSRLGGRGGEGFISPRVQREQIQAWAKLRGVTITEWHEDIDVSGARLERPGLDALLDRLRAGKTQGVAVARLDRLSRAGVADALALVESIHGSGGQLAIVDLGIDPTTTIGEFAVTVMLALARMQRRQIAEGWAEATRRAVERGVHAHATFGYEKPGRGMPLQPSPHAHLVAELFKRRAGGESWTALAAFLDAQCPPARGARWTRRAVQNIITNRVYLGEARYGAHVQSGAHPPLVTVDLFEAAQLARSPRPSRGEPALLSGLVRCAGCRHRMHAATVGSRRQQVYRCKRSHGEGDCPAPATVMRSMLDALVTDLFLAHYGDIGLDARIADQDLAGAKAALAEAERELEAYQSGSIRRTLERLGPGRWEAGLEQRVEQVLAARQELEQARTQAAGIDLGDLLPIWPELTAGERRSVMHEGVDAVFLRRARTAGKVAVLDPGRVRILWRGQAPHDLPGPGRRVELRGLDW